MSRPSSRIKMGYYPLPVEEARKIRTLLRPTTALPVPGLLSATLHVIENTFNCLFESYLRSRSCVRVAGNQQKARGTNNDHGF